MYIEYFNYIVVKLYINTCIYYKYILIYNIQHSSCDNYITYFSYIIQIFINYFYKLTNILQMMMMFNIITIFELYFGSHYEYIDIDHSSREMKELEHSFDCIDDETTPINNFNERSLIPISMEISNNFNSDVEISFRTILAVDLYKMFKGDFLTKIYTIELVSNDRKQRYIYHNYKDFEKDKEGLCEMIDKYINPTENHQILFRRPDKPIFSIFMQSKREQNTQEVIENNKNNDVDLLD